MLNLFQHLICFFCFQQTHLSSPSTGRGFQLTIAAVLLLLWEEGIRHSFEFDLRTIGVEDTVPGLPSTMFWVLRELVWWWVVSVLATTVVLFAAQSPVGQQIARACFPASAGPVPRPRV